MSYAHDALSFAALLLSGMLGALLVGPSRSTFATVRARIERRFDRR